MESQTSSPPIVKLSVELKQMILSNIPDISSLRSAALSCHSLYNAFLSAETIITTRVLLNEVDFDVLSEAFTTQKTFSLEPKSEENIQDFIATHLRKRQLPPSSWSLSEAMPIAKLHACVNDLALRFIASAAPKLPKGGGSIPATRDEVCRVERALYRFEVFCNLFRGFEDTGSELLERLWSTFFSNFSPWENEQLACVHDYLVQAVFPAYCDVAEHDIAWGEFQVEYGEDKDNIHIQHLLSFGLETLRQISLSETYEERYELLDGSKCPHSRFNFLHKALDSANKVNDNIYLDEFTPADELTHINPPFFDDPDTGPSDAWRWAHKEETRANFVNQENRETLREWGYVMWDRTRLDASGILQHPWVPPPHNEEEENADTQRRAEMRASWRERTKMYWMGGRGWWSLGDHSKIIWPGGKAPWERPYRPTQVVPKSLEEAKDAFRLMRLPESVKRLSRR